jgi:flagellar motor switch/type III secretory pathway protein FliN
MAVRPFRLCTATERESFQAHAAQALQAWAHEWSAAPSELRFSCAIADDAALARQGDGDRWLHCEGAQGAVWIESQRAGELAGLLFGARASGITSLAVAECALLALMRQLAGAPEAAMPASSSAPEHLAQPGRAVLCVEIEAGAPTLRFLVELPASKWPRAADGRASLGSAQHALGQHTVAIDAWLGEAEIQLGLLRTLAVGDVLVLNRKLDDSLDLRVGDRRLPCVAYLGMLDGQVAVEVARR